MKNFEIRLKATFKIWKAKKKVKKGKKVQNNF